MVGVELTIDVGPVLAKARDRGVVFLNAGPKIIRMVPPLVLEPQHVTCGENV